MALSYAIQLQGQESIARFTDSTIEIDGIQDTAWDTIQPSSSFWQYFPSDSIQAPQQTQVKFLFDNQNLYVLIVAEADYDNFITPSLRRDFSSRNGDSVTLVLDTFGM